MSYSGSSNVSIRSCTINMHQLERPKRLLLCEVRGLFTCKQNTSFTTQFASLVPATVNSNENNHAKTFLGVPTKDRGSRASSWPCVCVCRCVLEGVQPPCRGPQGTSVINCWQPAVITDLCSDSFGHRVQAGAIKQIVFNLPVRHI